MSDDINYKNNPLHGLSLKNMLIEIVDHYGFEILYAYLRIHCFDKNPDIASSVKFLKKTDWAREKVESFYLYQYKNLPRCSNEQFELPPRDRIVPEDQVPGEPAELSIEEAEELQDERARKAAAFNRGRSRHQSGSRGKGSESDRSGDKKRGPRRGDSAGHNAGYGTLKRRRQSMDESGIESGPDSRADGAGKASSGEPVNPWATAKPKSQD